MSLLLVNKFDLSDLLLGIGNSIYKDGNNKHTDSSRGNLVFEEENHQRTAFLAIIRTLLLLEFKYFDQDLEGEEENCE